MKNFSGAFLLTSIATFVLPGCVKADPFKSPKAAPVAGREPIAAFRHHCAPSRKLRIITQQLPDSDPQSDEGKR